MVSRVCVGSVQPDLVHAILMHKATLQPLESFTTPHVLNLTWKLLNIEQALTTTHTYIHDTRHTPQVGMPAKIM